MNRRTVIITGMHRSGTSCVAGMLAAATDLKFGQVNRQYLADAPRGNYENANVVELNDQLIGGWKTPREPRGVSRETLERIEQTVEREYPDRPETIYAIKDPRFLFTLDLWQPYLGEVHVIRVQRNLLAVTDSLVRRERTIYGREMTEEEAWNIWGCYAEQADHLFWSTSYFALSFDDLTNLVPNLGIFCWDVLGTPFDADRAEAFFSRTLVHHA